MSDMLALYRMLKDEGVNIYDGELGNEIAVTLELGGQYALFVDAGDLETRAQETAVIAHEAGHIFTGALHAVSSPYDLIEKHEYKADAWAYRYLIPPARLRESYRQGYRELWELAEHLDLPQSFVAGALRYYATQAEPAS